MPENNDQESISKKPNLEAKLLLNKDVTEHSKLITARILEERKAQNWTTNGNGSIKSENNKIS